MRFRFCGDADCPDWILSEIHVLSRLSSIKVKLLSQIVCQGLLYPPIEMSKVEKIFTDAKLDGEANLKGCMACLSFIITSSVRFNCDYNALHMELQQLGSPREHSAAIKKVVEEYAPEIRKHLKKTSLTINRLTDVVVKPVNNNKLAQVTMTIDGNEVPVRMTPYTLDVMLENLKTIRPLMADLQNNPMVL